MSAVAGNDIFAAAPRRRVPQAQVEGDMNALPLVLLLLQAPGDGWALAQAPPQQVKTLYWDLFQTTEVWVSLIPADPDARPPLVRLIFQAFFAGREVKGAPSRLTLRALPLPLTVITDLSLRVTVDGETADLAASCSAPGGQGSREGNPCFLLYPPCGPDGGCSANGVAAELSTPLLRSLARSRTVEGVVLGFPVVLSRDDRAAIGQFAERIGLDLQESPPR